MILSSLYWKFHINEGGDVFLKYKKVEALQFSHDFKTIFAHKEKEQSKNYDTNHVPPFLKYMYFNLNLVMSGVEVPTYQGPTHRHTLLSIARVWRLLRINEAYVTKYGQGVEVPPGGSYGSGIRYKV